MKALRKVGAAGIASAALIALSPTTYADGSSERSASDTSGSTVHRVSHALANEKEYTGKVSSGYKWGEATTTAPKQLWADPAERDVRSGYKWSEDNTADQAGKRWGRRDASEQAGKRWGRRDASEQAGKRWGRRDASEQAGKRWGRR